MKVVSLIEILRWFRFRYSFICEGTSTWRQRRVVFESSCYYQSNQLKIEAIPLTALPKDTTTELVDLSLHYPFFYVEHQAGKQ